VTDSTTPILDRVRPIIEVAANLAIVAVAALGCLVLFQQLRREPVVEPKPAAASANAPVSAPQPGTKLSLPGIDWSKRQHTLLLVLSTKCRFCNDSLPFYRQLSATARTTNVGLVAVFPQSESDVQQYLGQAGLIVDQTVQGSARTVGTRGTPTLLLVDRNGIVQRSWMGQLPKRSEAEVLDTVKATSRG
jgi:hypothetical protein